MSGDTGWIAAGAIATGAAAVATATLALMTKNLARKTADTAMAAEREAAAVVEQGKDLKAQAAASLSQVEVATAALEANSEPLLIPPVERSEATRDVDTWDGLFIHVETGALPTRFIRDVSGKECVWVIVR